MLTYEKRAKELLSNINNEAIVNAFWEYYQDTFDTPEIKTIDDILKKLIKFNTTWIEDMIQFNPARKEYWDSVLNKYK